MKKGVLKFLLAQSFVSCVYQVEVVFLDVPNDSTSTVATRRLLQKSVDQFITYELSYLFGKFFSQQTSNGRNAVSSSNCSNYSINIFIPFLPYYPVTLFSHRYQIYVRGYIQRSVIIARQSLLSTSMSP